VVSCFRSYYAWVNIFGGALLVGRPGPRGDGGAAQMNDTQTIDPIPMFLTCPGCGARHIDEGEFAHASV
jgi:hypothetical protein